jgi:hypothetical protein
MLAMEFLLSLGIAIIVFVLPLFGRYCHVFVYFIPTIFVSNMYFDQFLLYVLAYYNINNYCNKILLIMAAYAHNTKSMQLLSIHYTGTFNVGRYRNFVEITI